MGASVEQQMDLTVLVPRHDDRLWPDRLRHVVVGARNLAFVTDINPGPVPDVLELELEVCRVAVERAVHAIRADQFAPTGNACRRAHVRRVLSSSVQLLKGWTSAAQTFIIIRTAVQLISRGVRSPGGRTVMRSRGCRLGACGRRSP